MAELEFEGLIDEPNRAVGGVALGAITLAVIASVVFYVFASIRNSALATEQRKLTQLQSQITSLGEITSLGKAFSLGKDNFSSAISSQVDWQAFWNEVTSTQVRGVFYTALSLDASGSIRLEGTAPSMVFLAKQIKSIELASAFSNVELLQTSRDEDRVKFSITFLLEKAKLTSKSQ